MNSEPSYKTSTSGSGIPRSSRMAQKGKKRPKKQAHPARSHSKYQHLHPNHSNLYSNTIQSVTYENWMGNQKSRPSPKQVWFQMSVPVPYPIPTCIVIQPNTNYKNYVGNQVSL